ncbi:hypothetical protein M7I_6612 [Glarea lozoyensis 74030]|uniref:Rhodopsin domain-containing protein n=1 Tax=Glarea lozoyensis (strain ATCC 74030 / MF5533) TaxID=1104152 RepID=H0EV20_GLAL7|nr:hypothetical protein M7I_6612 [Glarea lozoyensis 74030]
MNNVTSVQGIVGIVTDFYILLIPLWFVSGLRLPLGRKIGVSAIFLSGLIACVCAVVGSRLLYYRSRRSGPTTKEEVPPSSDPSERVNPGLPPNVLPEVPRPVMTGMRSFIWKGARSKPVDTGVAINLLPEE